MSASLPVECSARAIGGDTQKTTVSSMVPRHWMMLLDMTVSMSCCRCLFASSSHRRVKQEEAARRKDCEYVVGVG